MNPTFWGPHAWIFLHSLTFNFPTNPTNHDKHIYIDFFNSLKEILPCEKCAYNYNKHLEEFPVENAVKDRDTLVRWLIKVHNVVNEETGKRTWTYSEVIDEYKKKMKAVEDNGYSDETMIYKVIIIALVVFIGYHVYNKKITF